MWPWDGSQVHWAGLTICKILINAVTEGSNQTNAHPLPLDSHGRAGGSSGQLLTCTVPSWIPWSTWIPAPLSEVWEDPAGSHRAWVNPICRESSEKHQESLPVPLVFIMEILILWFLLSPILGSWETIWYLFIRISSFRPTNFLSNTYPIFHLS